MSLAVELNRDSPISLQEQLFEQLRGMILHGSLKPNTKLIATRFLAEQAGVSRTTVLLVYERLISEGYLETRPAIGTFVCATPPSGMPINSPPPLPLKPSAAPDAGPGEAAARSLRVDFTAHFSDASQYLQEKTWLAGVRAVLGRRMGDLGHPQPTSGVLALRQAIADRLCASRAMTVTADNVIIVTGRRQACTLIAHVLLQRGDRVVVETPGDEEINRIFAIRNVELLHTPADEFGLDPDRLPRRPVRLAYVTPTRQNPVGGRMTPARRAALLAWAQSVDAYLIEDEGDAEVTYHETLPRALHAEDGLGRVFHTGSFASTLGVGLGLGYIVAPEEMVEPILALKSSGEEGGAWLEQMLVAHLLASGAYDRHLRRLRKIYLERRNALIDALNGRFGSCRFVGEEAGSRLTWVLPDAGVSSRRLCEAARIHGVAATPLFGDRSSFSGISPFQDHALLLSYGSLPIEKLRNGVEILYQTYKIFETSSDNCSSPVRAA